MAPETGLTRRGALAAGTALLCGCAASRREPSAPAGGSPARADATIGFVGDVMLGRGVDDAGTDRPPEAVWGDVLPELRDLDGLFLNLECCLSRRGEPTPGRAYHFRADPGWALPALRRGNVSWAGLANNHVLDFGRPALSDTLAGLDDAGVAHAGAGHDRRAALEPARLRVGDLDVAVLAVTDQAPAYAAGVAAPGTAYLPMAGDPLTRGTLAAAMRSARAASPDLLVVSLHWGPNWVTRPAARYRRLARWLVDLGADVVHGHSAHVVQGVEVYRGRPIIHDAGDFVDDYALVGDLHNDRSLRFDLEVVDGRPARLRLRPVVIEGAAVHRAGETAARWLRRTVRERSAGLGTTYERDGSGLAVELGREP